MGEKRFDEAEAELQLAMASKEPWRTHEGWLRLGELHVAKGHLRRALGAFRKSQQTSQRGEDAFALHTSINAVTTVLLHLGHFFLHVHDETLLFNRPAAVVDLRALMQEAAALKGELKSSLTGALEIIEDTARAEQLLPRYADSSPTLELQTHAPEASKAFVQRWLDAQATLYSALLAREEPRNHS